MDDVIYYNELYDLYGSLLTDKQRDYFENYYFNNLSLGEMAENYNVSRNAIFKQLRMATDKLQYYEDNLNLRQKINTFENIVKNIDDEKLKETLLEIF